MMVLDKLDVLKILVSSTILISKENALLSELFFSTEKKEKVLYFFRETGDVDTRHDAYDPHTAISRHLFQNC